MNPLIIFPLGGVAAIRASIVADTQLRSGLKVLLEGILDDTAATALLARSMGLGIGWRNHTTDFNGYPPLGSPSA
jgi:hypothetical protein